MVGILSALGGPVRSPGAVPGLVNRPGKRCSGCLIRRLAGRTTFFEFADMATSSTEILRPEIGSDHTYLLRAGGRRQENH